MITSGVRMRIERDGCNPSMTSGRFVDIPDIKSGVGGDIGGKSVERDRSSLMERAEIGHISNRIIAHDTHQPKGKRS